MAPSPRLIFVLYDGIEHSVFESQVLNPLLKRLTLNKNLTITLVSFERKALSKKTFSRLTTLHKRLFIIVFKRGPFLGSWSIWRQALSLRTLLKKFKNYHSIARGPLAGLITQKSLTKNCIHYTLQARGLLAEEYRYSHQHAQSFLKWIYWLRACQLEYWEKRAYTQTIPTNFEIEVVSWALKDYLVEHYHIKHNHFSLSKLDLPVKISPAQRTIFKIEGRKKLGIPLSKYVYVYNGSAHTWQCPKKTILFFKKQLQKNRNSFLLILTTNPIAFKNICKESNLSQKTYTILQVFHSEVLSYLCIADTGLLFREKHSINWVSRPTKYLEYKAANLLIAHNKTIAMIEQEG